MNFDAKLSDARKVRQLEGQRSRDGGEGRGGRKVPPVFDLYAATGLSVLKPGSVEKEASASYEIVEIRTLTHLANRYSDLCATTLSVSRPGSVERSIGDGIV